MRLRLSLRHRWLLALTLLQAWLSPLAAQPEVTATVATPPVLELVESFPSQTDFDQPDLREAQTVWLEMIGRARREILWQTFYLAHEPGQASQPVVDALKQAAARGVSVQLLVDPRFYQTYPETLDELDALEGVVVRHSPIGPWLGGVMHAKAIFVDGEEGFLGSQNFDWRSLSEIRELGVHFHSSQLTSEYVKAFRWEWQQAGQPSPPAELAPVSSQPLVLGDSTVVPTFSPNSLNAPETAGDEAEILKLIDGAQRSLEIALLSYSPTDHAGHRFYPTLDNALRRAALRGVEVRLMVSHWVEGKPGQDHLDSLDALHRVQVRACRIPPSPQGEIPFARVHHSKYLVCDGQRAWLGTSNWQEDYFHASRNYGLVLLDGPLPRRLEQLFDFDWQRATPLHTVP
jgi:phosphatidylserine/phosphatidylglycerophosphate/cardiolipin synthase-like enzyme